jgi:hypothetical protein
MTRYERFITWDDCIIWSYRLSTEVNSVNSTRVRSIRICFRKNETEGGEAIRRLQNNCLFR